VFTYSKCDRLGFEKKNNRGQPLSPKMFSGETYCSPRTVACCGCLMSNQNVLIYTTHIKKVFAKLHSLTLRNKITEKE